MITDDQIVKRQLGVFLTYHPYQHIVTQALAKMDNIPAYTGFSTGRNFEVEFHPFLTVNGEYIEKLNITADISLFDEKGRHFDNEVPGCNFDCFLIKQNNSYNPDHWLLLTLDDLIFYLNRSQNEEAIKVNAFPKLSNCDLSNTGFNFINRGRAFRNQYFNKYSGPVFDLYYGDEFNELFAIASNGLAFLYRVKDRVMEEADLLDVYNYRSALNLYPRFNNAIAEVAGTIYAAWERIAFLFHEFYPLASHSKMAPSFKRYISDKIKESKTDTRWANQYLDWFAHRVDNSHVALENLRHPTVHYNKQRSPSGTRAVELMKQRLDKQGIVTLKQTWLNELSFLKAELEIFNEALEHAMLLLETWASVPLP